MRLRPRVRVRVRVGVRVRVRVTGTQLGVQLVDELREPGHSRFRQLMQAVRARLHDAVPDEVQLLRRIPVDRVGPRVEAERARFGQQAGCFKRRQRGRQNSEARGRTAGSSTARGEVETPLRHELLSAAKVDRAVGQRERDRVRDGQRVVAGREGNNLMPDAASST